MVMMHRRIRRESAPRFVNGRRNPYRGYGDFGMKSADPTEMRKERTSGSGQSTVSTAQLLASGVSVPLAPMYATGVLAANALRPAHGAAPVHGAVPVAHEPRFVNGKRNPRRFRNLSGFGDFGDGEVFTSADGKQCVVPPKRGSNWLGFAKTLDADVDAWCNCMYSGNEILLNRCKWKAGSVLDSPKDTEANGKFLAITDDPWTGFGAETKGLKQGLISQTTAALSKAGSQAVTQVVDAGTTAVGKATSTAIGTTSNSQGSTATWGASTGTWGQGSQGSGAGWQPQNLQIRQQSSGGSGALIAGLGAAALLALKVL